MLEKTHKGYVDAREKMHWLFHDAANLDVDVPDEAYTAITRAAEQNPHGDNPPAWAREVALRLQSEHGWEERTATMREDKAKRIWLRYVASLSVSNRERSLDADELEVAWSRNALFRRRNGPKMRVHLRR